MAVYLSGDVRRVMLDKVKVNASKGNANALSHKIAKTMLHSMVARRKELIELGDPRWGGEHLSAIFSQEIFQQAFQQD